jgi:hypothetical protein
MDNFVVINLINFSLFDFFVNQYSILHYKNFVGFDILFNMFCGNNYFVFADKFSYYDDLLDFLSADINDFELLSACFNKYFLNYVNKFLNVSSSFFSFYVFSLFLSLFYINFYFSKTMIVYIKINFFESRKPC